MKRKAEEQQVSMAVGRRNPSAMDGRWPMLLALVSFAFARLASKKTFSLLLLLLLLMLLLLVTAAAAGCVKPEGVNPSVA